MGPSRAGAPVSLPERQIPASAAPARSFLRENRRSNRSLYLLGNRHQRLIADRAANGDLHRIIAGLEVRHHEVHLHQTNKTWRHPGELD